MKKTFSQAYKELLDLKNEDKRIRVVVSSHIHRGKELVEILQGSTEFFIRELGISRIARSISPYGKVSQERISKVAEYAKTDNPDYVLFKDSGVFKKSFFLVEGLCQVMEEIAKDIPVIVVSELGQDFLLILGNDHKLEVMNRNDRKLKIKPSLLSNEALHKRNCRDAFKNNLVLGNGEFFEEFVLKKCKGDESFLKGQYDDAVDYYCVAMTYLERISSEDNQCLFEDLLVLSLLIRCLGCYVFGGWNKPDMRKCFVSDITKLISNLNRIPYPDMISDYEYMFAGLLSKNIEKVDFDLLLREHIF